MVMMSLTGCTLKTSRALSAWRPRHRPARKRRGLTICGDTRSMQEAVACVRQLLPQADIRVHPGRQSGHMRYDPSTTEAVIGYSPQFPMEEGFRRTINMVRAKCGLPGSCSSLA